ncbi:malonic semialdehyde reductase [Rhodococcus aerolatus]
MTDVLDLPTLPTLDDAGRRALFTEARTAGTFADTPVGDDELRAVWELARWAPTAANFQPLRVLFVRTPDGKARLLPAMAEGNREKTASAPVTAVLAMDTRFHELIPTVMPPMADRVAGLELDTEGRLATARTNATLQAAYLILAARAQGLATGPMGGFDADALDAEFFPDGRWRSVLVVNLGHPGEGAYRDRMPRLAEDEVLAWA